MTENIEIIALGAGQEVGRSCIYVNFKNQKRVIFDSGIHMQYSDMQKYPDYKFICGNKDINEVVDLVILTHFHLDHCGALPYLTQHFKYRGPIIATTPTKAMIPYMLEDFRKVTADVKKQDKNHFIYSAAEGKMSAEKIISIGLRETMKFGEIKITSYYAGHVLGAGMFFVEYNGLSVLYTGDYNSYADRHLGAAYAPRLNPNIIITETTYATTIRDTKRDRERKMLKIVTQTVENGGKVLIPVFALGRAQELSVLLQTYWNRTESQIPVYFSAGLIEKANFYYKLFIEWENQKIKQDFLENNTFNFKKVKPFDKSLIRAEIPYVLFATPGMLHGGTSLQVFKQWCGNPKNTLIIPGYCVPGTFGNKLLSGVRRLDIDHKQYDVRMKIENISFSAHADAKGIINLIRHVNAENIVFVHGDKQKMQIFEEIVREQLNRPVFRPANKTPINIPCKVRKSLQIKGLKQPSGQGFLIRNMDSQHFSSSESYKLAKDELEILHELNLMKELLFGIKDNSLIIDNEIKTTLQCPNQVRLQEILTTETGKLSLKKNYESEKIQKKKHEQEADSDSQDIEKYSKEICEQRFMDEILGGVFEKIENQDEKMEEEQRIKGSEVIHEGEELRITGNIMELCSAVTESHKN